MNVLKFSLIVTGHGHIVRLRPFRFYDKLRRRTVPSVFRRDLVTVKCSDFMSWFSTFFFCKREDGVMP